MTIPKHLRRLSGWTIGVALMLLSAGFVIPATGQRVAVPEVTPRAVTPRGDLGADEKSTIDLFQHARGSVVYINTRERVLDPWTRNMFSIPRGSGSGLVWDARGHIVTNFHVVAGASEARVRLNDGRDSAATLVGASPDRDGTAARRGCIDREGDTRFAGLPRLVFEAFSSPRMEVWCRATSSSLSMADGWRVLRDCSPDWMIIKWATACD